MRKLSKELIKKAAIELIKEKGLKEFTARNLGNKLEVTDAAIFKYFPSLRNLFEELLLDFIGECKTTFSSIVHSDLSAEEKLKKLLEAYEVKFLETDGAMPLLCFEIPRLNDVGLKNLIKEYWDFYLEKVGEIIEQGKKEGTFREDVDAKTVGLLITGYFLSKALRNLVTGEGIEEGFSQKVAKIILNGIKKENS
ncbi:MAG: TetR/AcrR family transcriptional regulator [Aquificae bacterium]|jgi:AcrR family transcriptional regulator|nr:TetR/AcrR family transcriptional regulator [Aquificota bacterium]